MTKTANDKRIEKMSRAMAKIICQLRREGDVSAADALSNAAQAAAGYMRIR